MKKLISISTGIVGDNEINCYKAQEVGLQIMNDIISDNFNDVKLKKINRVKTLEFANRTTIRIRDEAILIDPLLLSKKIMLNVNTDEELKEYFNYELSPIPLSLFDESGNMRKT